MTKEDKIKQKKYNYYKKLLSGGNFGEFDYIGLENEPEVIAWKKWSALFPDTQAKVRDQWDEYYDSAWNSYEGERYAQLNTALALGDMWFVREFSQKKYNSNEVLPTPSSVNPDILAHDVLVNKWMEARAMIKRLDAEGRDVYEEARGIFA